MQYILSEEEMQAVRDDRAVLRQLPTLEAMTNFCQFVACEMIAPHSGLDRPHGCIHVVVDDATRASGARAANPRYCDLCSVRHACPQDKRWSK